MEFQIPLNKFEKERKVIELHNKEGKTLKEISKIVHMSFRDISRIIKEYERKKKLEAKNKEENNQIKKISLSSEAFMLYQKGKKIDEVKVLLDIPFKLAIRYWKQYLKSIGIFESYEFYQEHSYDIPILLSINNFMKRNNVHIKDISNVLSEAKTIANLQIHLFLIKNDIEKLNKIKHNYNSPQNNQHHQLKPLPKPINWNYQYGNTQF